MSSSQIRNYEQLGFLPPAARTGSGHRVYGAEHLSALRVSRVLIEGYGWQPALEAIRAAHDGRPEHALAVADQRHAQLHRQREQVAEALAALATARRRIATMASLSSYRGRTLTIGAAAKSIGVNPSAVRYWESRGVIAPDRTANGRRSYDHRRLQQLQLIKLLRDIDYGFSAIAEVVNDLSNPTSAKARRALEQRRDRVEEASRAAARATSALIDYLDQTAIAGTPAADGR